MGIIQLFGIDGILRPFEWNLPSSRFVRFLTRDRNLPKSGQARPRWAMVVFSRYNLDKDCTKWYGY